MRRILFLWVILGLCFGLLFPFSFEQYVRFEHLYPELEGKTALGISSILQDREGFLWFGTGLGLARYDGYSFSLFPLPSSKKTRERPVAIYPIYEDSRGELWVGTRNDGLFRCSPDRTQFVQYLNDPEKPGSLTGDAILAIQEDRLGDLWIGTRFNGLNHFDRKSETFSQIRLKTEESTIWELYTDSSGFIWAGTDAEGLFRLDPETKEYVHYFNDPGAPSSLSDNTIWAIVEDREGTLWIGTKKGGLNRYVADQEKFIRYTQDGQGISNLEDHNITALWDDDSGKLWIGTSGAGIKIFDKREGFYVTYMNDPQDGDSISSNRVTSIFQDRSGIMWVGTERGGINKAIYNQAKFHHFKRNEHNSQSVIHNNILSILEDSRGNLWVGTEKGLSKIDRINAHVTHYTQNPQNPNSLNANTIRAIREENSGQIWLATLGGGVDRFDPQSQRFSHFIHDPQNPNSLAHNRVNALHFDRKNPSLLWIGTAWGLNKLDLNTQRYTHYINEASNPQSLSGNNIHVIFEDSAGNLWIGTQGMGLNRMDKKTGKNDRYIFDYRTYKGNGINSNTIHSLLEDRTGTLWIGTLNGLSRYQPQSDLWTNYSLNDGLPGDVVFGILMDQTGRIWLSTNRGLASFDPEKESFTAYGQHDGLQGHDFNPGACFQTAEGRMYFGGKNGFNSFFPEKIKTNPFVPPLTWTAFYRNNEKTALEKPLSSLRSLILSYQVSFITFEFAALHYARPQLNQFAYKLEGRDSEWNYLGPNNAISFSNLDPGEYILRVKAANPDGVWNEEGLSIQLKVLPPFWNTPVFIFAAAVLLSILAVSYFRMRKKSKAIRTTYEENLKKIFEKFKITPREQEIIHLILEGASNKDIEKKLFISNSTVRNHIYNIYQKLEVQNRLELINLIRTFR